MGFVGYNIKTHMEIKEELPWTPLSGHIALDFANTADWHASEQPEELLNSYVDLVNWSYDFDILDNRIREALLVLAANQPEKAASSLEYAHYLREALYRIFSAISREIEPAIEDLEFLKNSLIQAVAAARIQPAQGSFSLNWNPDPPDMEQMLWPITYAAMDLLLSTDLAQIGQCADDRGCGIIFIDTSRNHSRRWCRMESCGNRAKAQRYYRRKGSNAQSD